MIWINFSQYNEIAQRHQNARLYFEPAAIEMPGLTLEFVGKDQEAIVGAGQQLAMPSVLVHANARTLCR